MNQHVQNLTDSKCSALDQYNIIPDVELEKKDTDDTYLHIFRHNTDSSLNVLQCFYKPKKSQVYVLANKIQFDAFQTDVEHVVAHTSRIRYYVPFDQFVAFVESILTYDTIQRNAQKSTAKKSAEETKKSTAKSATKSTKKSATKKSAPKTKKA